MNEVALVDMLSTVVAKVPVREIERTLLEVEQAPAPVVHRFGPGIYIRELSVSAGTFIVGHHQNLPHLNVMLKGRVTVLNPDGTTRELVAPLTFVGQPGRKIGFVHEDMVWQNIYATDERDIDRLEAMFLTKSDEWAISDQSKFAIERIAREADRVDFLAALAELGVTPELVRSQSEHEDDLIAMPPGYEKLRLAASAIEGVGMFLTSPAARNEVLAPMRLDGKRTPAGRYTNHSANPNARVEALSNGDLYLVADQDIGGCRGGGRGVEVTIDYRKSARLAQSTRGMPCPE